MLPLFYLMFTAGDDLTSQVLLGPQVGSKRPLLRLREDVPAWKGTFPQALNINSVLIPHTFPCTFKKQDHRDFKRYSAINLNYPSEYAGLCDVNDPQACTEWASLKPSVPCSSGQTKLSSFFVFFVLFTNSTCLSLKSLHSELGNGK